MRAAILRPPNVRCDGALEKAPPCPRFVAIQVDAEKIELADGIAVVRAEDIELKRSTPGRHARASSRFEANRAYRVERALVVSTDKFQTTPAYFVPFNAVYVKPRVMIRSLGRAGIVKDERYRNDLLRACWLPTDETDRRCHAARVCSLSRLCATLLACGRRRSCIRAQHDPLRLHSRKGERA